MHLFFFRVLKFGAFQKFVKFPEEKNLETNLLRNSLLEWLIWGFLCSVFTNFETDFPEIAFLRLSVMTDTTESHSRLTRHILVGGFLSLFLCPC